jgi:hypothetical protein
MRTTQEYDSAIWTAGNADVAALGGTEPGILFALRVPTFGGVQVDGVCPRCGRWHTVALHNGLPSCFVIETKPGCRIAAKGVGQ